MGAFYTSHSALLMAESEASEAYKKKKEAETRAADRKDQQQTARRVQAKAGASIKQMGEDKFKQKLGDDMRRASTSKTFRDNPKSRAAAHAIDAMERHDRRHPKKEAAGYGIFTSLIAEEQVDDPDLGLDDTKLGTGDTDFGDNMSPEDLSPDEPVESWPKDPTFNESRRIAQEYLSDVHFI